MPSLYELVNKLDDIQTLFDYARTEEQIKVLRELKDNVEETIKHALSESVQVKLHHDVYMGDGIYVSIIRTGK